VATAIVKKEDNFGKNFNGWPVGAEQAIGVVSRRVAAAGDPLLWLVLR